MPALCAESARSASHRVGMKRRAARPAFTGRNPRRRHRTATHAVGDAAVDEGLDTYEKTNAQKDLTGEAWAVEHAFVARPDRYARMKKLNLASFVEGKAVYKERRLAF